MPGRCRLPGRNRSPRCPAFWLVIGGVERKKRQGREGGENAYSRVPNLLTLLVPGGSRAGTRVNDQSGHGDRVGRGSTGFVDIGHRGKAEGGTEGKGIDTPTRKKPPPRASSAVRGGKGGRALAISGQSGVATREKKQRREGRSARYRSGLNRIRIVQVDDEGEGKKRGSIRPIRLLRNHPHLGSMAMS